MTEEAGVDTRDRSEVVRPPVLQPGDRVAIVAPASPVVAPERLDRGLAVLRGWGLEPVVMPHVGDRTGFLAGTDADRLADLHEAWADASIRGIVCARGGYGSQRLTDALDVGLVRANPKVFVGFSDVTALHAAIGARAGLVTVHGPMAEWNDARTGAQSEAWLRRLLCDPSPPGRLPCGRLATLVDGTVTGRLLGGNLSMLSSSVGTRDLPDLSGAIVVLEDVGEPPYRIDRMLRHLWRAGALDGAAGLVFGDLARWEERRSGTPTFSVDEVLSAFAVDVGVPAVAGAPVGHGPSQLAVPLLTLARLDATAGSLAFPEPVTSP